MAKTGPAWNKITKRKGCTARNLATLRLVDWVKSIEIEEALDKHDIIFL